MQKFTIIFTLLFLLTSLTISFLAGCGGGPGGTGILDPTSIPTAIATIYFPPDPNYATYFILTQNPVLVRGSIVAQEVNKETGKILEEKTVQVIPLGNNGEGSGTFLRDSTILLESYDSSNIKVGSTTFSTGNDQTGSIIIDNQTGVVSTPTANPNATPTNTVPPGSTPTNTVPPGSTPTNTIPPSSTPTNTIPPSSTPTNTVPPTSTYTPTPTSTATNTPTSTPTPEPAPNPVEDNSNFVSPLPGNAGGVCVDQSRNLGYTVVGFEITQFNITNGTIVGSTNEGIVTGGFIDVTVNEVTGNFYGLTGSKIYEFDSSRNKLNTYSLGITDSRGIAIINGNVYFTDPNNNRISFRPLSNLSAVSQYLATGQVPNCRDLNYDNNSNLHVCTSSGIKIINSSTGNVLSTYGPSAIDVVITGNFARVCVSSGFQIWNISTNLKVHDTPLSYGQGITYYEYSGQKYTLFRDDNGVGQVRRYKD